MRHRVTLGSILLLQLMVGDALWGAISFMDADPQERVVLSMGKTQIWARVNNPDKLAMTFQWSVVPQGLFQQAEILKGQGSDLVEVGFRGDLPGQPPGKLYNGEIVKFMVKVTATGVEPLERIFDVRVQGYNHPPVVIVDADIGTQQEPKRVGQGLSIDASNSYDVELQAAGFDVPFFWYIKSVSPFVPVVLFGNYTNNPSMPVPSNVLGLTAVKFGMLIEDGLHVIEDELIGYMAPALETANSNPIIHSAIANPSSAVAGQTVSLVGSASDPDNDPLTYSWFQLISTAGQAVTILNSSTPNASFVAPSINGFLNFRLSVSDNKGGSASKDVQVGISTGDGSSPPPPPPPTQGPPQEQLNCTPNPSAAGECAAGNQPALADAGCDLIVTSGDTVVLQGSGSDPDNTTAFVSGFLLTDVAFQWSVVNSNGLSISLSNTTAATANFVAPDVNQDTIVELSLRVLDPLGCGTRDAKIITIRPKNQPPTANAGPDQFVNRGANVQLPGSGTDPDGDPLTFAWTQVSGLPVTLSNEDTKDASFIAPTDIQENAQLVFRLTVSDGRGGSAHDQVTVTVVANRPPVILSRTPDHEVSPGAPVLASVTAEDPDGDPLEYQWVQVGGLEVELVGTDTATVTFVAPLLDGEEVVTLQVNVGDGNAVVAVEIAITIKPKPLNSLVFPADLGIGSGRFEDTFIGVAILNPNPTENEVMIAGLRNNGISGEAQAKVLAASGQSAFLTSEIGLAEGFASLIARGQQGPIQGFFMVGDLSSERLDGIGGRLVEATRLFLPIARQTEEVDTLLFLFNPIEGTEDGEDDGNNKAQVTLDLKDLAGELIKRIQTEIPASGSLLMTMGKLFEDEGSSLAFENGYVEVNSSIPVKGFEFVASDRDFTSLAAQPLRSLRELIVPHYFVDGRGGDTEIILLNAETTRRVIVDLSAYDDDSNLLGNRRFEIPRQELFVGSLKEILEIETESLGEFEALSGYLRIKVHTPALWPAPVGPARVVGAISFSGGDGFRSVLPMIDAGQKDLLFLHVAQSDAHGFYQGLAVQNLGDETAEITLRAYDVDGGLTGEISFEIEPGHRRVDLLDGPRLFQPGFQQVGGHLHLLSSEPVAAFSLFGDFELKLLSAIEGQPPL